MEQRSLEWCFRVMKNNFRFIVLITALTILIGGITGYYHGSKAKPEYEISITLLIKDLEGHTGDETELDFAKYQALNRSILNHFNNLLTMEIVIDRVIDNLQLDMDYEEFKTQMDVVPIENSYMLKLQIKNEDPILAEKIVDELISVSSEKADKILGIKNIRVVDGIQSRHILPNLNIKHYIFMSGVLGILLALLIIFLREYTNKAIRTTEDVESYLNLPIIGMIEDSNSGDKLVICEDPDSFAADTYRNTMINMRLMQRERDIKTIVLTALGSNKGTSKLTANMAIALSKTGKNVLLIDAYLQESNISRFFDLNDKLGLSEVIAGEIQLDDVIKKSKACCNLDILPSGKTPSNPTDLLALENMKSLLEYTKTIYDVIFIDSPPLNVAVDAIILSTAADGTILVCDDMEASTEDIKSGKRKFEIVNSNILGVVLEVENVATYSHTKIF